MYMKRDVREYEKLMEGERKLETKALETDMWHNVFSQSDNTWKSCVVGGELVRFTNL